MSDLFLLLLGAAPDEPLRWGAFGGGRLVEGGWAENAAALSSLTAKAQAAERVIALLPGEQVACRVFSAAPRGASKQQAAANYLMEDELGEPADALRIGVAAERAASIAIAVRASIFEAWLEAFTAAGIACDVLSADYLALPSDAESATVVAEHGRVIAAFAGVGAAMEREMFAALAAQLFADPAMRISIAGEAALGKIIPKTAVIDWLGETDDARILSIFGEATLANAPPNFLRKRMLNRKAIAATIAPWRRAGLIAASLVGVLLLGVIVDGAREAREADRWRRAAAALHRQYFPENVAADPVTFARRRLSQGGGAQSFLWLASRFSDVLEANESVQIDRIRFNAARGEFVVSITSETDAAIETFKSALAAAGVATQDSGGYRSAGGVWTGELTARAQ